MAKIEKIEAEVEKLDRDELAAFRGWFHEYDSGGWDRRIEEDSRSGKLDKLASKAIESHERGETGEL